MSGHRLELTFPPEVVDAIATAVASKIGARAAGPPSPYLTTTEAAAYLRASKQRIHDLTSQGRLPVLKDGARCLYRTVDLDAYLEGRAS